MIPPVAQDYMTAMGGVDRAYQQRSFFATKILRLKKWWCSLFFFMLDVAAENSRVLLGFNDGRECRYLLAKSLAGLSDEDGQIIQQRSLRGEHTSDFLGDDVETENGSRTRHQRKRSCYCQKKAPYKCIECGVALCSNYNSSCFELYQKFKSD